MQPLIARRTSDGGFVQVQTPSAVKLDGKMVDELAKSILKAMLEVKSNDEN